VDHARHDLELIARVAAGDGSAADARSAAALREACADCRSLDADLRALAAATRALRGAVAPAAPRDFRLTAADAARLRQRGLGRLFGRRGSTSTRGMGRFGGGLVAIGLVGLVFGSGVVGSFEGFGGLGTGGAQPAAIPASTTASTRAASTGGQKDNATEDMVLAPVQTGLALQPAPSASAVPERGLGGPGAGQASDGARDGSASGSRANPLLFASLAALVVGLGLMLAARTGRRAGP
jgi:hypothetical protein